ncbi:hypothetical protein BH695_2633 [Microcystis aeruginosa PCC 7806SL]|uniref:Uncharacterized protein n=1 Tax=Microcystis aeruginosa PCC 7806SL TaxID=1903187 RepID=A0AB33BNW7_MICA7|nr:hypothetical protein BH695_2633 [Microcystis aeruginosa PCC 7806SL]
MTVLNKLKIKFTYISNPEFLRILARSLDNFIPLQSSQTSHH